MIVLLGLVAFVSSALAVRAFLTLSDRRLVAQPGARSSHSRPTPTGGGFPALAVFLFVAGLAVMFGLIPGGPRWWAVILTTGILGAIGLVDDAHELPRSLRYIAQLLTAVAVAELLGHPAPVVGLLGVGAFIGTVVTFTGVVNAFNFMDGIDALVAAAGIVIFGFLAWFTKDQLWILLVASYGGFLMFNLPPARIFMGDAGSTALGGLVGVAVLSGRASLAARNSLLLVPLLGDSIYTVARRLIRGEDIFVAHHSHIYQRLLRAGHSHAAISAGYAAATFLAGMLSTLGNSAALIVGAVGFIAALLAIEIHLVRQNVPFTRSLLDSDFRPRGTD